MQHGIVVAPQPEAVEVGARIYMAGGNAVDAAIATAFAQGVVDGLMCGVAGLGSAHVYAPKQGRHEVIDFYCRAPLAARADMWTDLIEYQTRDGFSFVLKDRINDLGYGAIATPGSVAGFHALHGRYGRLKWEQLLLPAAKLAEDGYIITPFIHTYWNSREGLGRADPIDRVQLCPSAAPLFFDAKGGFHPIGTKVRNPDYGRTLRRLAAEGPDIFYRGDLAEQMIADLSSHGSLLAREDFERYRVVEGKPIRITYRGYEVAVNPPPGGGLMVAKMLNILEWFDLRGLGHNTPAYIRTVAEAMKRAVQMKEKHLGDPEMVPVPVAEIIDKQRAGAEAEAIRRGDKATLVREGLKEAADTTHLVAMDADGLTITMTHTLGYQSGVITDGLGFMYNGAMGFFDPRPGRPSSIAPGKSRGSTASPTILLKDGKPVLALGAPGGAQIPMGVLQVILNVVDHGMSVTEAIDAPRFSSTSDAIDLSFRIPGYVAEALEDEGYRVLRQPYSYAFSRVHAVHARDGKVSGAADPYAGGMALVV
jgi:gamma-glutamyltranspeptidase/glutathione hydrolase